MAVNSDGTCCHKTVVTRCAGCPHGAPMVVPRPPRKPKLLILGYARHGKDTVAELLRDRHGYTFASSSFFAAEKAVVPWLANMGITYNSVEECYADRVNHRAAWYDAISAYNGGGRSRLAEEILKDHDIYVGMRSADEFAASRDLFDHIIWVDASYRHPPEPGASMSIIPELGFLPLYNNGSFDQLVLSVDILAGYLGA